MCLLVCVPLFLQSSRLLWLCLVSCSVSLGKSFTGKLILKILCWWICLTFWIFVRFISALVVWDFSYVMVVVCCLTLLEIWHFATVLCNWKFAQLRTTSCMRHAVACDSTYITSIYGWVIRFHPPIFYTYGCKCDCMQLHGLRSHCITCKLAHPIACEHV
jgi:hypothetical protein